MDIDKESTLAALIRSLKLDPVTVVAEVNREIVPKERFESHVLAADDRIELVRLVGGG